MTGRCKRSRQKPQEKLLSCLTLWDCNSYGQKERQNNHEENPNCRKKKQQQNLGLKAASWGKIPKKERQKCWDHRV